MTLVKKQTLNLWQRRLKTKEPSDFERVSKKSPTVLEYKSTRVVQMSDVRKDYELREDTLEYVASKVRVPY